MISTRTVYDLIYLALREIGIAGHGDTISADVSQEALLVLNSIRAEWSINSKSYRLYDQTYFTTSNQTNVTLGTNGALIGNIATRPQAIQQITVIYGQINQVIPVRTVEEYRQISVPNIFSIPQVAYIDQEFPIQTVYLYPGLASGYGIRVMGTEYMTEYENISDPYIDPIEYFSALYLNLALRLAPKYGVDVNNTGLLPQAMSAMKHIKAKLVIASLKPMNGDVGGFSMWTGRGH